MRGNIFLLEKPAAPTQETPAQGESQVQTTPAVRALAKKMNIDLSKVKGTGKDGRITKEDVVNFAEKKPVAAGEKPKEAGAPSTPPPVSGTAATEDKLVKISGIKKAMTKSMTEAWHIPHCNIQDDICIDNLKPIRQIFQQVYQGKKLTYLPFFIKAISQTMREFPIFNAVAGKIYNDGYLGEYIEKANHNISIAMDTPAGLIAPNLKSVQLKSIYEINEELRIMIEKAKKGTLTNDDLSDGTFTFSNVGSIGGINGSPVIFRPQVAIAAMGIIRTVPIYNKNAKVGTEQLFDKKDVVGMSLTFDHRLIDGATGARFLNKMKLYVEEPGALLWGMK